VTALLAPDPADAAGAAREDIAAFQARLARLAVASKAALRTRLAAVEAELADRELPADRRPLLRLERATIRLRLPDRANATPR
jgi:hypothetical protein